MSDKYVLSDDHVKRLKEMSAELETMVKADGLRLICVDDYSVRVYVNGPPCDDKSKWVDVGHVSDDITYVVWADVDADTEES